MIARTTARIGIRRLAAMVCLFVFCLGPARLVPELVAFFAGAEGSHAVRIANAGAGAELTIVLRHEREASNGSQSPIPTHQHGLASRMVCLLGDSRNNQGDHTAQFATGAPVQLEQKPVETKARSSVASPTLVTAGQPAMLAATGATCISRSDLAAKATARSCLRSTCLLI